MENKTIEEWNEKYLHFSNLTKKHKSLYNYDFIYDIRNSAVKSIKGEYNVVNNYFLTLIGLHVFFTLLHFIISVNSDSIDFFSFFWFKLYLFISILLSGVYTFFKYNKYKEKKEEERNKNKSINNLSKLLEELGVILAQNEELQKLESADIINKFLERYLAEKQNEEIIIQAHVNSLTMDAYKSISKTNEMYNEWLKR